MSKVDRLLNRFENTALGRKIAKDTARINNYAAQKVERRREQQQADSLKWYDTDISHVRRALTLMSLPDSLKPLAKQFSSIEKAALTPDEVATLQAIGTHFLPRELAQRVTEATIVFPAQQLSPAEVTALLARSAMPDMQVFETARSIENLLTNTPRQPDMQLHLTFSTTPVRNWRNKETLVLQTPMMSFRKPEPTIYQSAYASK